MDGSIIVFEPYPFEGRRGEWGRYRWACDECGIADVARLCFHCGKFLCYRCNGQETEHNWWLYTRARERLLALCESYTNSS